MTLYELAVMGSPTGTQLNELESFVVQAIADFGLNLGREVSWTVSPASFSPPQDVPAAVVFFGGSGVSDAGLSTILKSGIPIIPVTSSHGRLDAEIPDVLKRFNCMVYDRDGHERIGAALLECAGLLRHQRRVFVSYRRDEAREAALQLFDALSARLFEVFLDTHGIAPGDDFQAVLWHRLSDSDVLVMLDTAQYFSSQWTAAEFGRALSKGISVLRVGWPTIAASPRTIMASHIDLQPSELDIATGLLSEDAIHRVITQLELVRSRSQAVRSLNMYSNFEIAVQGIGGSVAGVGLHKSIYVDLPGGELITVYPTIGVPSAVTIHDALTYTPNGLVALLYDHVGLHPKWQTHLDWLGSQITSARLVKACDVGWKFGGWPLP